MRHAFFKSNSIVVPKKEIRIYVISASVVSYGRYVAKGHKDRKNIIALEFSDNFFPTITSSQDFFFIKFSVKFNNNISDLREPKGLKRLSEII